MFVSFRNRIRRRYQSIPKRTSRVVLILGIVLFFTSLMLIPSSVLAYIMNENMWPFIVPMAVGLVLSVIMVLKFSLPTDMRPADGLMMMFSVWMLLFAFGTIPYLISGFTLDNAIFESISGFTTTGATIITDVTSQSHSLLLWRAITNWIGGIIIVMMFMFIIPMVVSGGRALLKNEMSGSGGGNLTMKLGIAARQFIVMYVILTAIFMVVLLLLKVSVLDSLTIAMSSISIGGFLNTNDSMVSYSIFVKVAIMIFLIIAASNFYLHYRAIFKRDITGYARSEEFRVMIVWFTFISVFIVLQCIVSGSWMELPGSDGDKLVDIVFTIISVGTTAGFSTVDNYTEHWGAFLDLSIFMILMVIGGSAGSTSGGVKISRIIITLKSILNEIRQEVHPNAVYMVRYDGNAVNKEAVHSAMVIMIAFLIVVGVGAAFYNVILDLDNAVYISVAMVTNTGTGSGVWFSGFSEMPVWAKMFSCVLMFLGRMEILAILAVFTPGFWVEFIGRGEINRTKSKLSIMNRVRNIKKRKRSQADNGGPEIFIDEESEMPADAGEGSEKA